VLLTSTTISFPFAKTAFELIRTIRQAVNKTAAMKSGILHDFIERSFLIGVAAL
jgi:hypothetical protein